MIFLDFLRDPTRAVELGQRADGVLEELAGLVKIPSSNTYDFEGDTEDELIIFHKSLNYHHYSNHVTENTLLLKDLLVVSSSYLKRLPEVYDAFLFKQLKNSFQCYDCYEEFFQSLKIEYKLQTIEKCLFLINVSEILSKHIEENKTEYCQKIADSITQKNIQSMGSIRLKKQSDSGSQRSENFFQRITALILQRPQKPKWIEEPLFDQERLSLVLGNDSPYQDLLYGERFLLRDWTARRLYKTTAKDVSSDGTEKTRLRIPNIINLETFKSKCITANFHKPFEACGGGSTLLARQLNLFLPARRRLEEEFWKRYEEAHCVFPESPSRLI